MPPSKSSTSCHSSRSGPSASRCLRGRHSRAVGGPSLAHGAEIECSAIWKLHRGGAGVEENRVPSWGGPPLHLDGRSLKLEVAERDRIAEAFDEPADGGVDDAVGRRGGVEAGGDRVSKERRHLPRSSSRSAVEPAELGARLEAAARLVDTGDHFPRGGQRRAQRQRVSHGDCDRRSHRRERRAAQHGCDGVEWQTGGGGGGGGTGSGTDDEPELGGVLGAAAGPCRGGEITRPPLPGTVAPGT